MSEEVNTEWQDSIPESLRAMPIVQEATDAEAFWKRIEDQQGFLGRSLQIPTEEAGDEDWGKFHEKVLDKVPTLMRVPDSDSPDALEQVLKRLGKPEDTDGYTMPESDDVKFDDAQAKFLKESALAAGLTQKQFNAFAKAVGQSEHSLQETNTEYIEAERAKIRQEWGEATDERKAQALDFVERSGAPAALKASIEKNEIDAASVLWLYSLSKNMGGTQQMKHTPDNPAPAGRLDPTEAEQRISEIYANPDHPYHRGEPKAVKRFMELVKAAEAS